MLLHLWSHLCVCFIFDMNVYDFDKTIYKKDSTVSFFLYCFIRNFSCILYIPLQIWGFLKYIFGFIDKTAFKGYFFSFVKGVKDINFQVEKFWQKNGRFIADWYLQGKSPNDVIISASPRFLLEPICRELGVGTLICSEVDEKSGKFLSENCYGEEKVRRLKTEIPEAEIESFYSDSLSDSPLAALAKHAYVVKKSSVVAWEEYHPSFISKMKKIFFSKEFFAFLLIGGINAFNGILFASLFSLFLNPNLAFIIGYVFSLTISYLLNSFLAFKEELNFEKYIKFCVSYIPNFLIQNGLVILFFNVLGWNKFLVYTIAVIVAIPVTFLMIKFFTFSKKKN